MRREIRILILGDEQVGKTSLITSLITETFSTQVPHVLPEITIPPEITPDNVNTILVDSSCHPDDRVALEYEIRRAHVICLVYAIDEPRSFHRLSIYWLPYIRSLGANAPIVLVGNKIDLRGDDVSNERLEEEILPIMNEYKEVETCVECSALSLVNVTEVFYFAQKAVLHPTLPLYDSREHVLKPACEAALCRIFKLCDSNCDGIIDDTELNDFQIKCFKTPLQSLEIKGIKMIIYKGLPSGIQRLKHSSLAPFLIHDQAPGAEAELDLDSNFGITEQGFVYLHKLFIERGRLETTWTALRKFGYDDNLSLRDDVLHPPINASEDSVIELSPLGYQFFTELFAKYDQDKDGALSTKELDALFATTPGNPWIVLGFPETTLANEYGSVTLQGFLAQWSMTTLLDPIVTLEYLAYLGYPDDSRLALKIIRGRKKERPKERAQRDVFWCAIIGATGSGKTSLLRSFISRQFTDAYIPTMTPYSVVNGVDLHGTEKYLVLQEIGPNNAMDRHILSNPTAIPKWDLVCFVYDSSDPNSFSYIVDLRKRYEALPCFDIPAIIVATKSDLDRVSQRNPVQPDVYCVQQGLPTPLHISVKSQQDADLFQLILSAASDPNSINPSGSATKQGRWVAIKKAFKTQPKVMASLVGTISIGMLFAACLMAHRWKRSG